MNTWEGSLAAQHLVDHAPERPDVGTVIDFGSLGLLGTHVGDCPDRRVELGKLRALCQQGQPKVENLHPPVRRDDDVAGFDIAVDDAGMRFLEPVGDLSGAVQGFLELQRSLLDPLFERLALDILQR